MLSRVHGPFVALRIHHSAEMIAQVVDRVFQSLCIELYGSLRMRDLVGKGRGPLGLRR